MNYLTLALPILSMLFISACSQNQKPQIVKTLTKPDFSGAWEMDYSLNDSAQAKLDNYFRRMRKAAARHQQSSRMERSNTPQQALPASASTVYAMAQFAEQLTRTNVLDIKQTQNNIHIDRVETFSLDCFFGAGKLQTYDSQFGKEVCGWDGHQLVFHLALPQGLSLQHRLTVSKDRQQLNIATSIRSDQAPEPFTLNRSYTRFEGVPNDINCRQTVSRGKVCSLVPDEQSDPDKQSKR